MQRDPKLRLGAGVEDAEAVKAHPFFERVDWEKASIEGINPVAVVY